jgi:microcystin degradation protein MlrC/predicted lactoylglutathione lyase
MAWSEAIQVMLLTHAKWRTFTQRPFPPAGTSGLMLSLAMDSREAVDVDAMNRAAAAHGGQADANPPEDFGFMYSRDLADPDGHLWATFWMDPAATAGYAVRWRQLPLMSHTLRSTTLGGAMLRAVQAARGAEAQGMPAVSIFAGFSLADIATPCVSVVVTGADTPQGVDAAQAVADRVAAQIWEDRAGFVYRSEPLVQSLVRALALASGASRPVLLLDHGDNCMSGGTCDTMDVLVAALEHGLRDIAVGPLCDPQAVESLVRAGVGAAVTIPLGNKVALSQLGIRKEPVTVAGAVLAISDGEYTATGPIYTGQRCSMGRTVLLDIGAARIVVTERPHEPFDIGVFQCVGVDPGDYRFVLLKSRMYCRPVFEPLAHALVECDSLGVTTSDYSAFPFVNVRHPVYPLDPH